MQKVLFVEDEVPVAEVIRDYLVAAEYEVALFHRGGGVVEYVKDNPVDLLLLDIMLPDKDGTRICKEVRDFSDVPIIMLTAKVDEVERLLGYDLGADDYICKPVKPREILARVKAVLRRSAPKDSTDERDEKISLDDERLEARVRGAVLDLTAVEYRLLRKLAATPGRIYSREQIARQIYDDYRVVNDRTIDSHIRNLRKKLRAANADHELVHSIYGVGYKFQWDD